jgi:hypothetical protein
MRLCGKRAAIAAAVACAAAGVVDAATAGESDAPSAVARTLPKGYRILLTEEFAHGAVHVARYGKTGTEAGDTPLTIESVRDGADPRAYEADPDFRPGDKPMTVRGHPAVLRTLTDEGRAYAKELVWRERPDLVVAVSADLPSRKRRLPEVAEGVQIIDQPAWAFLREQTSYAAIIGHVTRELRRLRVRHGTVGGHTWTLYALIPPHFPLSRDDRRVSCYELTYRGRRGHGTDCGTVPNWQRVGGRIFVFGAVEPPLRRVRVRPSWGRGLDLTIRTVRARRGPRVRYYAVSLPEGTCAVSVSAPHQAEADGSVAGPIRGYDRRRCASASRSG